MRPLVWLLSTVSLVGTVTANVEKTIFLAPAPAILSDARPSLDDLRIPVLAPALNPVLETELSVQFPTAAAPRGLESWYLLRGLDEGRRYEVRICWPATSPTDFWLDTFSLEQVFETPELIASLATFSQQRHELVPEVTAHLSKDSPSPTLFLRIQAAASFYSLNRTLMEFPPAVDADIILDPFILNILPQSLAPVAAYITVVAIGAWFLTGYVSRWLQSLAVESPPKSHPD